MGPDKNVTVEKFQSMADLFFAAESLQAATIEFLIDILKRNDAITEQQVQTIVSFAASSPLALQLQAAKASLREYLRVHEDTDRLGRLTEGSEES